MQLQTISGATNLQNEIGTKTYIISKLFGPKFPLVEAHMLVVEWIGTNFECFERQAQTTTVCTSLAYDLSRVEVGHYNTCIYASILALLGDPVACTPSSFQMLIDKLTLGHYRGQLLLVARQLLLISSDEQGRQTTTHWPLHQVQGTQEREIKGEVTEEMVNQLQTLAPSLAYKCFEERTSTMYWETQFF